MSIGFTPGLAAIPAKEVVPPWTPALDMKGVDSTDLFLFGC